MHESWNLMISLLEVDTCLNFFIYIDVIGLTDVALHFIFIPMNVIKLTVQSSIQLILY